MKGKGWRDTEIRVQCPMEGEEKVKRGNVTVSETDRPRQNKERKLFAVLNRYSSLLSQIEGKNEGKGQKINLKKQTDCDRCARREKEKHNCPTCNLICQTV